jgi:hypothetical protein
MIDLLLTLAPMIGSAGAGSLLKMLGGAVQEFMAARSLERREKMALILSQMQAQGKVDNDFQKTVFGGNNEDSKSSLLTRRILAIMGMLTFAAIAILAAGHPTVPLATFTPPEAGGDGTRILWGLVTTSRSVPLVTTVTMGHLAIMSQNALVMILAFYFTPGGRK